MSTLNGFGTMFYGWKHRPGEYSSATKWLTALYLPVVPLGRYTLRVATDFGHESTKIRAIPGGLLASQENRFDIAEKTSLHGLEVLRTYLSAYVGLPVLMFGPFLLILLFNHWNWLPRYSSEVATPGWLDAVLWLMIAFSLASVLYWPIWAFRRSRGMQSGSATRAKTKSKIDRRAVEHHL